MSIQATGDLSKTDSLFTSDPAKRGFVSHCKNYVDRAEGCRDAFDWLSHLSRTWEILAPSAEIAQLADRARSLFDTAGLGLSFPQLIADTSQVVHSISTFVSGRAISTANAVKDFVFYSLLLVNTVTRAILFLEGGKVFSLAARQIFRVNVVLSTTAFLTDGADLVRDWAAWNTEGGRLEESHLALLNVIKNASSVGVSALLLVSYTFAIALTEPVLAGSIFALSSIYLSSKISSYFYDKMVVEELTV